MIGHEEFKPLNMEMQQQQHQQGQHFKNQTFQYLHSDTN